MIHDHSRLCSEAFANGLRPEPEITVSQWAANNRILVQSSSAEPGEWRNERTPYLVEIMDSLSPFSGVEQVSVMKGAQGGFTEAGNNWIGAIIHRFPGPVLYVQPTVETVKRYSQIRLSPMIQSCPALRERVGDSRSRDSANTIFLKEFPGGALILGGANSAVALRSMPIRYLFLDEVDAYPNDVDGEGDPIELAQKRTNTFRNRKIFKISTPLIAGLSHIERAFLQGDQRRWWVPCPFCDNAFIMRWRFDGDEGFGGLIWTWGKPQTAQYQCPTCGKLIAEHYKTQMNNRGAWRPSVPGVPEKIRSYHWPSLYSPYGWPGSSWGELAKKWEQGHKDPTQLKVFLNAELGLPYEDKAARSAEPDSLLERCESFPETQDGVIVVPNGVAVITLGCDVQPNRVEYEIVGWGRGEESWSIFKGNITGDTSAYAPFNELDQVLLQKFRNEFGFTLTMHAACIDANFNTQTVTNWAGSKFQRRVWAVRGSAGRRAIWPRLPGKTRYNNTPLFTVGVDPAKESIIGRLNIIDPGPGYCHFPLSRDQEYFEQLTSEVCITVYDKTPPVNIWKKRTPSARNEALDCRVYAYAALCGLIAGGLQLDAEVTRISKDMVQRKAEIEKIVAPPLPRASRGMRFQMSR